MRSDGPLIWELTKRSPGLDLNSPYCYLLLCSHFSDTCLVAESDGALAGFVTAYVPPGRPDTIFVWQIAVAEDFRRAGLGRRLVDGLLDRLAGEVAFLEATVTPSNEGSRSLFRAVARSRAAPMTESPFFEPEMFPTGDGDPPGHEPELLLHVGPMGRMEKSDQPSDSRRRDAQCR